MRFEIILIETGGRGGWLRLVSPFQAEEYVKLFHMKASKIFFVGFA
jgi:hypothetical protein